jgi:hypothetical protein
MQDIEGVCRMLKLVESSILIMFGEIPVELLVGALSAVSALAGAYLQSRINLKAQRQAIQAANKRASTDYLLQKEADALMELLKSAERCHSLSYQYANQASADGEVSDELAEAATEALADFESDVRTNGVFLDKDDQETLDELLGSVRSAMAGGDHHIRGEPDIAHKLINWQNLMDDFNELRRLLRRLMRERIAEIRNESN